MTYVMYYIIQKYMYMYILSLVPRTLRFSEGPGYEASTYWDGPVLLTPLLSLVAHVLLMQYMNKSRTTTPLAANRP